MRRTPLLVTGALAGLTAGCGVQGAVAPVASGSTQWQVTTWSFAPDHTKGTHWHYVDPDRIVTPSTPFNVRSTGLITVDLSATLSGAPVAMRLWDNGDIGHPSRAVFAPEGNARSFSFTFSNHGKKQPCGHTLRLEWKSLTGKRIQLRHAQAVVNYQPAANNNGPCT